MGNRSYPFPPDSSTSCSPPFTSCAHLVRASSKATGKILLWPELLDRRGMSVTTSPFGFGNLRAGSRHRPCRVLAETEFIGVDRVGAEVGFAADEAGEPCFRMSHGVPHNTTTQPDQARPGRRARRPVPTYPRRIAWRWSGRRALHAWPVFDSRVPLQASRREPSLIGADSPLRRVIPHINDSPLNIFTSSAGWADSYPRSDDQKTSPADKREHRTRDVNTQRFAKTVGSAFT